MFSTPVLEDFLLRFGFGVDVSESSGEVETSGLDKQEHHERYVNEEDRELTSTLLEISKAAPFHGSPN